MAVIPARFESSRFPGKPLARLAGKPMVQHVYERVRAAALVSDVLVATDDERIMEAVERFGGQAVMTSGEHPSGTDRVAEVAGTSDAGVMVNVQGDEPLIRPRVVDLAIEPLLGDETLKMATLAHPFADPNAADLGDPDVVKVIVDPEGYALDFLRTLDRTGSVRGDPGAGPREDRPGSRVLRHIGLYAYRRSFLLQLAALEPTERELALGLEQLRPLEHGCRIRVMETDYDCVGVDRPSDLERAERLLAAEAERLKKTKKEALS
jgi:3-deoxy-manno-octulosonate cytidylyltransferase (CMP-KDO synthetase)